MSQWKNTDDAANSVLWAVDQYKKPANTTNQTAFFGNTTANAFFDGVTVGQYGVSTAEMAGSAGVASIAVSNPGTGFTARPTIAIAAAPAYPGVNSTATADAKVIAFTVDTKGTGYAPGNVLTVAGAAVNASSNATANVTQTEVVSFAIGDVPGTGYSNSSVVGLTTGTGQQAMFNVVTGDQEATYDIPQSLTANSAGGYTVNPTLGESPTEVVEGTEGTGLTIDVVMGVKAVALKAAGAYTTIPTLDANEVTGGTGTGAKLDITMGLRSVTVTAAGSGYTSVPAVTVGGAGGTNAIAAASLQVTGKGIPHAGWVVRTEGQGGRAGRVQYETLVAMSSITGDASDDTALPE